MGKKSGSRNSTSVKNKNYQKQDSATTADSLHEGRTFSKRKTGVWITYSKIFNFYRSRENGDKVGILGEET